MTRELARLRLKTWVCAPLVVLSGVLGNYFMKRGMPPALAFPLGYLTVLFRPYVALGVALLILWLLSRMALLSWADLSYVVPVTSVGYALTALAGQLFLHENVDWKRWTGIAMIVAGVALVGGFSAPRTFQTSEAEESVGRRKRVPLKFLRLRKALLTFRRSLSLSTLHSDLVSGHGFSRAASWADSWALAPAASMFATYIEKRDHRGLKPDSFPYGAARLKPCPDTRPIILSSLLKCGNSSGRRKRLPHLPEVLP